MDSMDPNSLKAISDFLPSTTKELLLNDTADAIGRSVGGLFYLIGSPLIKIGIIKKQEFYDLTNKAAQKIDKIPVDRRDVNKLGLMLKAIENAKYSLDSEILRDYFSELIASSIDKNNGFYISPMFSTILANMSRKDAEFIAKFKDNNAHPKYSGLAVLNLKTSYSSEYSLDHSDIDPNTFDYLEEHTVIVKNGNSTSYANYDQQINFFQANGILEISFNEYPTEFDAQFDKYSQFKKLEYNIKMLKAKARIEASYDQIELEKGAIKLTALGKSFVRCVVP